MTQDDISEPEQDEDATELSTNSVFRTLKILESLSFNQGVTLEEFAPVVNFARPTLFRFLSVLQRLDYVEKSKDNRYRLTPKLFTVASRSIEDVELTRIAKPFLEDMSFDTGETAIIGILDGDSVLHLNKVESKYNIRFYERIGKRNPLYCTVMGKIFLAAMTEDEFSSYVSTEHFVPYTQNTITDPVKLREVIELTRLRGYAEGISELEQDIHALGCPVYDHQNRVIAAVNINWPLFREVPGKKESCLVRLQSVADSISAIMGYIKK